MLTETHNRERVLVLGPVAIATGDDLTPLRGQQGEVLCALAARYPGSVPADQLVDLLWPDGAPRTARTGLGVVIHRLRERWTSGDFIVNEAGAYRLALPVDSLDSACFEHAVRDAMRLNGDPRVVATQLDNALRLWRGDVFQPFDHGTMLSGPATQLTELRRDAEELLVDRLLEGGQAENAALLGARYVESEPYRERRWQQLMLALYRTDRQAEALRVGQRAADFLRDELGIEPSHALRSLESNILNQSPELAGPSLETVDVSRFVASLNQRVDSIPITNSSFVGRDSELETLTRRIDDHGFVTVIGAPGSGKSRLVAEFARGAADRRVIWVDLVPSDDARVVHQLAERLGVNTTHNDQTVAIATALGTEPTILVFDNSEHLIRSISAMSTALLGAVDGLQIIVTSRIPLGCAGEMLVELAPLSQADSRLLIKQRAFGHGASSVDVGPVADILNGVPLFLELVAPALATVSATQLADEIRTSLSSIGASGRSDHRHQTLATTLDWSLALLPPEVAKTYTVLGVLGTPFGIDDVCALIDAEPAEVRRHLHTLARHYLVVTDRGSAEASFRMLVPTRTHALQRLDASGELQATRHRHARHFVDLAVSLAADLAGPNEVEAVQRLNRSLPQLVVAHSFLSTHCDDLSLAATLVISLFDFSFMRQHYSHFEWADQVLDLRGVDQLDHYPELLATAGLLAWARDSLGTAAALASESIAVSEQRGQPPCLLALRAKLNIAAYEHNVSEAAVALMALIGESERQGDDRELAVSLVTQTLGEFQAGMFAGAEQSAARSLKLAERTGNPSTIAWAQFAVGTTMIAADPPGAIRRFTGAVRLAKQVENHFVEGMALGSLASVLRRSGRVEEAAPILADVILFWGRTKADAQVGFLAREVVLLLHGMGEPRLAAQALCFADRFERVPPLMGDDYARFETLAVELRAEFALLDLDPTTDSAVALAALLVDPKPERLRHLS